MEVEMSTLIAAAGWILMAAALFGAVYGLIAVRVTERFFKSASPLATQFPPMTLVKPLSGAEPGLGENLATFCTQDYPGAVQMVFGVQAADDPAIKIVDALRATHPDVEIELVVGTRREGLNPKISNLIGMVPSAKHDVLILSDSDIGVPADYLRGIVGALEQPGVGAVTCFYRGAARDTLWSKLAAMGIDYQFLPNAVFAVAAGLARPCFGSTIGVKTSVLREIGGFEAFEDRLADDYAIGAAIRSRGYQLAYPPIVLTHTCSEATPRELFEHEVRWSSTVRSIAGAGHAGSVVTHVLPLALLGALLLGFSYPAVAGLAAAATARLVQTWQVDRLLGQRGRSLWLLPGRDMLSFAVFVSSFFTKQVDWRGRRYQVKPSGVLSRG
jgi:ceramide glucosyltransferase